MVPNRALRKSTPGFRYSLRLIVASLVGSQSTRQEMNFVPHSMAICVVRSNGQLGQRPLQGPKIGHLTFDHGQ